MSTDSDPNEKPTLFSEAPGYVKFFIDPSRPKALRIGVGAVIALIFFYPLIAMQTGGKREPAKEAAKSESKQPEEKQPAEKTDQEAKQPAKNEPVKPDPHVEAQLAGDEMRMDEEPETTTPAVEPSEAETAETDSSTPFKSIPNVFRIYASIDQLASGDVWVTTMHELAEFKDGAPQSMVKKLDSASFDRLFDRDLAPITAAYTDGTNELWTGSSDGELMHYANYDWKVIFEKGEPINSKIQALIRYQGDLYIGGKGLMKWNVESGKLTRVKGFNGTLVKAFLVSPKLGLLVAATNGVWRLTDGGWQEFHGMSPEQGGATALYDDGDRGIIVGTENGLIRLSPVGVVGAHSLTGHPILSLSGGPKGELWAGTGDNGLRYFDGQSWYQATAKEGIAEGAITQVLRDKHDQVWMAVSGKGLWVGPVADVIQWIKANKEIDLTPATDQPRMYKNACRAAEKELTKSNLSGAVSSETIDGTKFVFFSGKQVCPPGLGFRRDDGKVVLLRAWNITVYRDGERQEVTVPKMTPADQATTVFLDSRERIWVGTAAGPSYYDNGQWTEMMEDSALGGGAVQAIVEDGNAAIWLGTSPRFNKDTKEYEQKGLHRFDQAGWTHFGPESGLIGWIVNALLALPDGRLAVGTSGGLCFRVPNKDVFNLGQLPKKAKQNMIVTLSADEQGGIWATHLYFAPGVTWYHGTEVQQINPSAEVSDPNLVALAHDGTGQVWLAGTSGKLAIFPRGILLNGGQVGEGAAVAADEPEEPVSKSGEKVEYGRPRKIEKDTDDPKAAAAEQRKLFGE